MEGRRCRASIIEPSDRFASSFCLLPPRVRLRVPSWLACLDEARPEGVSEVWAHQDSNLGQAGYEPAALTAELWARNGVYQKSLVASRLSSLLGGD